MDSAFSSFYPTNQLARPAFLQNLVLTFPSYIQFSDVPSLCQTRTLCHPSTFPSLASLWLGSPSLTHCPSAKVLTHPELLHSQPLLLPSYPARVTLTTIIIDPSLTEDNSQPNLLTQPARLISQAYPLPCTSSEMH